MNAVDSIVADLDEVIRTAPNQRLLTELALGLNQMLGTTMKMVDDLEDRSGLDKSATLALEMGGQLMQMFSQMKSRS